MIGRVSDANTFEFFQRRSVQVQVDIRRLQEQILSGRRLLASSDDPLAAGQVVRSNASLQALAQWDENSEFGVEVLHAQDQSLGEANDLLVRAEEIASQMASGLYSPAQRAAAREEVHGILQGLTTLGNSELAGRRLFSGLALDAPEPFTDPDASGYTAAAAFTGSTHEFETTIGNGGDRVRLTTNGGTVFGGALQAVEALEQALATNGDVGGTLAGLGTARDGLAAERASVGARQAQLTTRASQVKGLTAQEASVRADARDADFVVVATQLAQAQTALQALLAAAAQMKDNSLVGLLQL